MGHQQGTISSYYFTKYSQYSQILLQWSLSHVWSWFLKICLKSHCIHLLLKKHHFYRLTVLNDIQSTVLNHKRSNMNVFCMGTDAED